MSQTKKERILDEKIGTISLVYTKITENSDTNYMVHLAFQNAKYQSITDIKIIGFFDTTNLNKFKTDLLSAYKILKKGEKVDLTWDRPNYRLNIYEFGKNIYIAVTKGTGGYTILNIRGLENLLENLSLIDLGKDQLLPEVTIDELSKDKVAPKE